MSDGSRDRCVPSLGSKWNIRGTRRYCKPGPSEGLYEMGSEKAKGKKIQTGKVVRIVEFRPLEILGVK